VNRAEATPEAVEVDRASVRRTARGALGAGGSQKNRGFALSGWLIAALLPHSNLSPKRPRFRTVKRKPSDQDSPLGTAPERRGVLRPDRRDALRRRSRSLPPLRALAEDGRRFAANRRPTDDPQAVPGHVPTVRHATTAAPQTTARKRPTMLEQVTHGERDQSVLGASSPPTVRPVAIAGSAPPRADGRVASDP